MLNIRDIIKNNKTEPSIVTDTRDRIKDYFKDIIFKEDTHQYFRPQLGGTLKELQCVSHVAHQFVPYVDWDQACFNKAMKLGVPYEELKEQWHYNNIKATNSGTHTHEFAESYFYFVMNQLYNILPSYKRQLQDGYLLPNSPKEEAVEKFWEWFYKQPTMFPVLSEAQVYTDKYSGTFDLLAYHKHPNDDKKSGFLIMDYKGLPLDMPIAVEEGWKKMGDLKVGDIVFDKHGKKTKILNVSNVHFNPCMKITFDDKDTIIADNDHRWLISFSCGDNGVNEQIMTTQEIFQYLSYVNSLPKNKRHAYLIPKILVSDALILEKKSLLVDPYILGLWLNDGGKTCGMITAKYKSIWDEIVRRGYSIGKNILQGRDWKSQSRIIFGLDKRLKQLNLQNNKHIPDIYLRSSYEQRLELLQGIMDNDGRYDSIRNRYVMSTTSKCQSLYMMRLLSTLGIKAVVSKTTKPCTNGKNRKKIKTYDVCFITTINPFLKKQIKDKKLKMFNSKFRHIISIEKTDTIPTKCIEVDSSTHTYLAGYNMIVTHNTNTDLYSDFNQTHSKCLLNPFEEIVNENIGIYTIQLNAYQLPLQDLGINIIGRVVIWLKSDGEYELIKLKDVSERLRKAVL